MTRGEEFALDGRVVLVTGAAGLIGGEVVDAVSAYGARVVLTDLSDADALADRAADLASRHPGAEAIAVPADLTRENDVARLLAAARERFGALDVLIHLAAIDAKMGTDAAGATGEAPFETEPLDGWQRSLDVNATAMVRVTQHALRAMLPRRRGTIVLAASTYALVAPTPALYRREGDPASSPYKPLPYVATKSMVPGFVRYIAARYGSEGIRCNAIAPHGVDDGHDPGFRSRFAALSPLGRMCAREELRGPFVFLASDASSYMTGTVLTVDGGWTAW